MPIGWKRSPGRQCRSRTSEPTLSASKYSCPAPALGRPATFDGLDSPRHSHPVKLDLPCPALQLHVHGTGAETPPLVRRATAPLRRGRERRNCTVSRLSSTLRLLFPANLGTTTSPHLADGHRPVRSGSEAVPPNRSPARFPDQATATARSAAAPLPAIHRIRLLRSLSCRPSGFGLSDFSPCLSHSRAASAANSASAPMMSIAREMVLSKAG